MAKQLTEFPTKQRGRTAKYPWEQWLDGKPWELFQGEDFTCKPVTMQAAARRAAAAAGLKVRVAIAEADGNVVVQAYEGEVETA